MSQITRVPWGLQGFLGSKNQGDNPSELAQTVAPTLDLSKFFGIENDRWTDSGSAVFASPTTQSIEVDPNELWLLKRIGVRVGLTSPTAGDALKVYFGVTQMPNVRTGTAEHPIADQVEFENTNGVSAPWLWAFNFPQPVVLWPGSFITADFVDFTLGAGNFSTRTFVNYERLII